MPDWSIRNQRPAPTRPSRPDGLLVCACLLAGGAGFIAVARFAALGGIAAD